MNLKATVGKAAVTCQGLNAQNTWVLNGDDITGFVLLGKFTSRYNVVSQKYPANIVRCLEKTQEMLW